MSGKGFGSRRAATVWAVALLPWASPNSAHAADLDAIRQKVQVCAACHGPEGNSINPAVPSLAGQPKQFITTQLIMFREGNRKDSQMSPVAANLSNADIDGFGTYFADQKLLPPTKPASTENWAAGRQLTVQFRCVQCHGPQLLGQQHIPRLAGQQAEYLRAQLRGFKASTRFDMDGNMTSAAQSLSATDIDTLAEYLAVLH